jgi:nitric oxide reductase subunit B
MLGLGLTLFCLRALRPGLAWKEKTVSTAFWLINGGLVAMVVLSMLPIGILQAVAAIDKGLWFARSAEFMQTPLIQNLRWLRMVGDTAFGLGALMLAWFILGLVTGRSYDYAAHAKT